MVTITSWAPCSPPAVARVARPPWSLCCITVRLASAAGWKCPICPQKLRHQEHGKDKAKKTKPGWLLFRCAVLSGDRYLVAEMGGLVAETLGTETFLVSVPVRPEMSGLEKSRSRETPFKSLRLGLDPTRPKIKVSVSVLIP